jgi:hypothetical protein
LVSYHFFRRWQVREGYVDLTLADYDLFHDGFDDVPLVLNRQFRPAGVQPFGLRDDFLARQIVHLHPGDLGLELGKLGDELVETFLGGLVELAEALGRDLVREKELVGAVHVVAHLLDVLLMDLETALLFSKGMVGLCEMGGDAFGSAEERLQFLVEYPLQIYDRNLVPALLAYVFRGIRLYVHLLAARAEGEASKELHGPFSDLLVLLVLFLQHLVTLIPQCLWYNRLDLEGSPIALGLLLPFPVADLLHAIDVVDALGARAADDASDGNVAPVEPPAGAVARII